jgi:hypothetical protein
MRSLLLRLLISGFMLFPPGLVAQNLDLFKVEKPLEDYDSVKLDAYFELAMSDLMVRLVGDVDFPQTEIAQNYIRTARQWVLRFQRINREVDGVVIGQNLLVEFDRDRLLNAFQQDSIQIWPLEHRPKTWVVGQWEQRGLAENISERSLEYRPDLDYRAYGRLLGLPIQLPKDQAIFDQIDVLTFAMHTDGLDEYQRLMFESQAHYVLFYKADQIGEVVSWIWGLYSIETGQRVLHGEEVGDSFLGLIESTLDGLLDFYSAPYRQALGSLGLIELVIEGVDNYQVFNQLEQKLLGFKPTINDIRLTEVTLDKVKFEVVYNGQLSNLLDHLADLKQIEWAEHGFFQGQIKGRYAE